MTWTAPWFGRRGDPGNPPEAREACEVLYQVEERRLWWTLPWKINSTLTKTRAAAIWMPFVIRIHSSRKLVTASGTQSECNRNNLRSTNDWTATIFSFITLRRLEKVHWLIERSGEDAAKDFDKIL